MIQNSDPRELSNLEFIKKPYTEADDIFNQEFEIETSFRRIIVGESIEIYNELEKHFSNSSLLSQSKFIINRQSK